VVLRLRSKSHASVLVINGGYSAEAKKARAKEKKVGKLEVGRRRRRVS